MNDPGQPVFKFDFSKKIHRLKKAGASFSVHVLKYDCDSNPYWESLPTYETENAAMQFGVSRLLQQYDLLTSRNKELESEPLARPSLPPTMDLNPPEGY